MRVLTRIVSSDRHPDICLPSEFPGNIWSNPYVPALYTLTISKLTFIAQWPFLLWLPVRRPVLLVRLAIAIYHPVCSIVYNGSAMKSSDTARSTARCTCPS